MLTAEQMELLAASCYPGNSALLLQLQTQQRFIAAEQ